MSHTYIHACAYLSIRICTCICILSEENVAAGHCVEASALPLELCHESRLYRLAAEYVGMIPAWLVQRYVRNVKSFLGTNSRRDATGELTIQAGDGCTGSGVWSHYLRAALCALDRRFSIGSVSINHALAAENDEDKQSFLLSQHDIGILTNDVTNLPNRVITDIRQPNVPKPTPHVDLFGGGYSCKDKSTLNSSRSSKKHGVRIGQGETGGTYGGMKAYICHQRPFLSFLENSPNTENKDYYNEDNDSWEADSDAIKQTFEEHDFSVICCRVNGLDFGAVARRERWWGAIIDLLPSVWLASGGVVGFNQCLNCLKMPAKDPDSMFFDDKALEALCSSYAVGRKEKRPRTGDVEWKAEHQEICLLFNVAWPRDVDEFPWLEGLQHRQLEICSILNALWPCQSSGWEFADINNSLGRLLGFVDKTQISSDIDSFPKAPWSSVCPTFTAKSTIICRRPFVCLFSVLFVALLACLSQTACAVLRNIKTCMYYREAHVAGGSKRTALGRCGRSMAWRPCRSWGGTGPCTRTGNLSTRTATRRPCWRTWRATVGAPTTFCRSSCP